MLCTCIIPRFSLTRVSLADLNGVLGNYATLGLNIADFARYANKPSAQNVQAVIIPVIFSEFYRHTFLMSILLIIWIDSYCWSSWHLHCRSRSDSIWLSHLEPHPNHRSVDG
jgi:cytosine/uracil/thiamine/allantoin permease